MKKFSISLLLSIVLLFSQSYTALADSQPPFGTQTVSYQVVDNPTLDFGLGVLVFVGGMWFVVWLFRKR